MINVYIHLGQIILSRLLFTIPKDNLNSRLRIFVMILSFPPDIFAISSLLLWSQLQLYDSL